MGNAVSILRNASQNYPAWLAALGAAKHHICFENYIFSNDATGRSFAAVMAERARRGVQVRVVFDWVGCVGEGTARIAWQLAAAGAEVRMFNPPRLDRPLALLSRDHRKAIAIDGEVAFVSGLCVSDRWVGKGGSEEWRDTGVELRGPAVSEVARAFVRTWAAAGGAPIRRGELIAAAPPAAGEVSLRVVAAAPNEAGLFRLDLLLSSLARRSLFLADASSSRRRPTWRRCARQPAMASTSGSSSPARATCGWRRRSRAPGTGRCSRRGCGSSSGT